MTTIVIKLCVTAWFCQINKGESAHNAETDNNASRPQNLAQAKNSLK